MENEQTPEKERGGFYKFFQVNIFKPIYWLNGSLAGGLLYALLNCSNARRQDVERLWNARFEDKQAELDRQADKKIQQAARAFDPKIEQTQAKIDSLQRVLDSINVKKS